MRLNKMLLGILIVLTVVFFGCVNQGLVPENQPQAEADASEAADDALVVLEEDVPAEEAAEEVPVDEPLPEEAPVEEIPVEEVAETEETEIDVSEASDEEIFKTVEVNETQPVKLRPKTVDLDEDVITYTFTEPLNENGEWQTDYGDAGEYIIGITVSDGENTVTKKVKLIVTKVNVAPVVEDIPAFNVKEGTLLDIVVQAEDPNKDEITYSMDSDKFEQSGNTFSWDIGYQTAGNYDFKITVSDGEFETIKGVKVIVNKNNVAPELEEIDDIEVDEGETIGLELNAVDVNGDPIAFSISPDRFVEEGGRYLWKTKFTDNGIYDAAVTASDGELETVQKFTITINDINKPPVIEDIELG